MDLFIFLFLAKVVVHSYLQLLSVYCHGYKTADNTCRKYDTNE